jgi:hypothetical protein
MHTDVYCLKAMEGNGTGVTAGRYFVIGQDFVFTLNAATSYAQQRTAMCQAGDRFKQKGLVTLHGAASVHLYDEG